MLKCYNFLCVSNQPLLANSCLKHCDDMLPGCPKLHAFNKIEIVLLNGSENDATYKAWLKEKNKVTG